MKRLTRSNEKIVAGAMSGISNSINPEWGPVFLRIVFIMITYYNPAFLLIYVGLTLMMPIGEVNFKSREATTSTMLQ